MNLPFTIAAATTTDIPALVALINSAYRGDTSRQGWTTEADLLDGLRTNEANLRELMQAKGATILKYLNQGRELLGCVYLKKQADQLYLGMLTVRPARQAGGIGGRLLHAAEDYARQHACQRLTMTVISVRTALIAWYERQGYRLTGEYVPFPTDTQFGIPKQELVLSVMEKTLPQNP